MSGLSAILDLAVDILTIIAILAGGYWSLKLYRQKRQKYPHANVTHEIFSFALPDGNRLVRLGIRIENCGEVLIKIVGGRAWVQQMIPVHEHSGQQIEAREFKGIYGLEIDWPKIGNPKSWRADPREIEPHESDTIYLDFIVDSDAEVINVYSYLDNVSKRRRWSRKKKQIGWPTESIHQLPEQQMAKQTSNGGKRITTRLLGGEHLQGGSKKPPQAAATPSPSPDTIRQGGPKEPPQVTVVSNTPPLGRPTELPQTTVSNTQTDAGAGNADSGNS